MRPYLVPLAVCLTASSALAVETPGPQPPASTTAAPSLPPPPAPPAPPPQDGVLVRRPGEVLAGQGLAVPRRPHFMLPQRHWADVMPSPLGARDGKPLAGYHGGLFYMRDRFDTFRFYIGAALHIDSLNYFGSGISNTDLKSTVQLRRLRVNLGGEILNTWQWFVQPEWTAATFDNATGTTETSAAAAGKDPDRSSGTYAPVQGGSVKAALSDAYVNYGPAKIFNIQVGQFQAPFTMENRTSSNTTTFMETSMAVRALGMPLSREIGAMTWGALPKNLFYYSAGVFLGEGPNRPNADNRADAIMRYYVRPLARSAGAIKEAQLGVSFKWGMREKDRVAYDYSAMTTGGGYAFWKPTYNDSVTDPASSNTKGRLVHIIPSGAQTGIAAELRVPFHRFDLRSEFVYVRNNTREAVDGYQVTNTERLGTLKGYGYYVQLGYWIWGKPFLTGAPGEARPPHADLNQPDPGAPPQAVELAVRWEQLRVAYDGSERNGKLDAKNIDGDIKVDAFSVGATYWATRHLRVTLDYGYYHFPGSAAGKSGTGSADERALAPGNRVKDVNASSRQNAHALHELTARLGFQF
jgi:phosphate-selective porin